MQKQINKKYQICQSCIMDTSDPNIFNKFGKCSHCLNFEKIFYLMENNINNNLILNF